MAASRLDGPARDTDSARGRRKILEEPVKLRDLFRKKMILRQSLTLGLLILVGVIGCSEDSTKPPTEFAPPTNLTYVNGNGQVTLAWDASPDQGTSDFAGYNVYRHTASLAGIEGEELATYKINPEGSSATSYIEGGVENGTKDYYSVRAEKDNGDLTESPGEIDTAPRSEGLVTIAEFSDTANPSGLDLSTGTAYAMSSDDPDNRLFIDLYLGTTGDNDEADQPLAVKSPHLVLGGTSGNWTRQAAFKLLDDEDDATTSTQNWLESITLGSTQAEIEGKVIAVRTPVEGSDFHYGKLVVLGTSGANGQRQVQLLWAYQELPNYIRF